MKSNFTGYPCSLTAQQVPIDSTGFWKKKNHVFTNPHSFSLVRMKNPCNLTDAYINKFLSNHQYSKGSRTKLTIPKTSILSLVLSAKHYKPIKVKSLFFFNTVRRGI